MPPCRRRPSAIIPGEKSAAITSAPLRASATLEAPVPAARSRMRWPARGATARVVAARQKRSLPRLSTVLVRSYPARDLVEHAAHARRVLVQVGAVGLVVRGHPSTLGAAAIRSGRPR